MASRTRLRRRAGQRRPRGREPERLRRESPTATGATRARVARAATSPSNPTNWRTLYGTWYNGSVTRCDQETGVRWDVSPTVAYPESEFQAVWTLPVVFSEAGSHALYFGNEYVWRTTDGGQSWDKASPILTRKDPGAPPNLDPATADDLTAFERASDHWGVVYTIAPSPIDAGRVWAGTDDGLIWVTTDACGTWTNVTPPGLKPWAWSR